MLCLNTKRGSWGKEKDKSISIEKIKLLHKIKNSIWESRIYHINTIQAEIVMLEI